MAFLFLPSKGNKNRKFSKHSSDSSHNTFKRIWAVSRQCSQFFVTLDILNTTDTNTYEQYLMYSHFYLIKVITKKLHIHIIQKNEHSTTFRKEYEYCEQQCNIRYKRYKMKTCTKYFTKMV